MLNRNAATLLKTLDALGIYYHITNHLPVHHVDDIDICGARTSGIQTKTLILCSKKSTDLIMVVMSATTRLDIKKISHLTSIRNLTFLSIESLKHLFRTEPGYVSPFVLEFTQAKNLQVLIAKTLLDERILAFHPHTNTATLDISTPNFLRYLSHLNINYLEY